MMDEIWRACQWVAVTVLLVIAVRTSVESQAIGAAIVAGVFLFLLTATGKSESATSTTRPA
jgi:hypothetical protein